MSNNSKRRLVVVGLENPDGTPNGSMNILETLMGFSIKPGAETLKRDIARGSLSKAGSVIGAKQWDVTLPLEMKGGGIDTLVVQQPPMHPLLLAAGLSLDAGKVITVSALSGTPEFKKTVDNTTAANTVGTMAHFVAGEVANTGTLYVFGLQDVPSVADALDIDGVTATVDSVDDALVYLPESDRSQHHMATIHGHYDGQRRVTQHAAADLSFSWEAGKYCTVNFTLKGTYATPSNETVPTGEFNDLVPPIVQSAGLTLGDYPTDTGTIEKLDFSLNSEISPVADINSADGRHSFRITDRAPTGGIDPESVTLGTFNPFSDWESGSKAAIFGTLGTVAGERVSLVIPKAQYTSIGDKERAGSDAYDLGFELTGDVDDEFYLFFH